MFKCLDIFLSAQTADLKAGGRPADPHPLLKKLNTSSNDLEWINSLMILSNFIPLFWKMLDIVSLQCNN